jgi:SIR2-like domain
MHSDNNLEETSGAYENYDSYYANAQIPLIDMNNTTVKGRATQIRSPTDILFLLGAGASVPAGINAIVDLVGDLKNWLKRQGKKDYLELTDKIIEIISTSPKIKNDKGKVDIERLLDITERLEGSHKDLFLDFYGDCIPRLQRVSGYYLISNGNKLLSDEIKKFIKVTLTEKRLDVGYLKPLSQFILSYRPLHIFSTNYDICIETFCKENDKKCFDGFTPSWDFDEFKRREVDIRLYKLHGSIRWYRTVAGDYEASKVVFDSIPFRLDTQQDVVPLILYPGRKFEYIEPIFDMLGELKRQLDHVKYAIVIGYSFKDDHLAKMFRYAANSNANLVVFLVSPNAHRIYYEVLKRHVDIDFQFGYYHESFTDSFTKSVASKLQGKVICLPYRIEEIIGKLQYTYLKSLSDAQELEKRLETSSYMGDAVGQIRWDECLRLYAECEHTEKIESMIKEKMDLNKLIEIDYHRGGKIILKSFLNNLLWETGRRKWLSMFEEYMPISPQKIEIKITASGELYLRSKQSIQQPFFANEAISFYKSLLEIYENHLIFSNKGISKTPDNNGLKIGRILEYLNGWKRNIPLPNWLNGRRNEYPEHIQALETEIGRHTNAIDNLPENVMAEINRIESSQLEKLMSIS